MSEMIDQISGRVHHRNSFKKKRLPEYRSQSGERPARRIAKTGNFLGKFVLFYEDSRVYKVGEMGHFAVTNSWKEPIFIEVAST